MPILMRSELVAGDTVTVKKECKFSPPDSRETIYITETVLFYTSISLSHSLHTNYGSGMVFRIHPHG